MSNVYRVKVLSLYKQLLRLGRNWTSKEGTVSDTAKEQQYIISEAKRLFKQNATVSNRRVVKMWNMRINEYNWYCTAYDHVIRACKPSVR